MKVVSPLGNSDRTLFPSPPPLRTLEGRKIGILSNGKLNANRLLLEVSGLLVERYLAQPGPNLDLTEEAQGPGFPAPGNLLERLTGASTLALVGVGD